MNKELKPLVISHYDKLLESVKTIAKHYAVDRVPLEMINRVIDAAKLDTKSDNPIAKNWLQQINKTTKLLKRSARMQSKAIGDNKLSVNEFELMIETLKDAFSQEYDKTETT